MALSGSWQGGDARGESQAPKDCTFTPGPRRSLHYFLWQILSPECCCFPAELAVLCRSHHHWNGPWAGRSMASIALASHIVIHFSFSELLSTLDSKGRSHGKPLQIGHSLFRKASVRIQRSGLRDKCDLYGLIGGEPRCGRAMGANAMEIFLERVPCCVRDNHPRGREGKYSFRQREHPMQKQRNRERVQYI